jgi:phospholipid/cholesterol/gamma-HCH transport system permease protein
MNGFVTGLGRFISNSSYSSGFGVRLAGQTALQLPVVFSPRRARDVMNLLFTYIWGAMPVTLVVSMVIGMILAINTGITLQDYGQEHLMGRVVAISMAREMGPLMTALILAASIGSGIAAEIGTMRVSEEIDALRVMSISPIRFLVVPRVVALTLLCPILTILAGIVGTAGGAVVSHFQFDVTYTSFRHEAFDGLELKDVYQGIVKAVVFGATIALVGSTQGLRTVGGATGVGQATRRAVVVSFVLVIVFGWFITWIFYR